MLSFREGAVERFRGTLQAHFGMGTILTGSGSAAFSLILRALKERSGRREVILPAYTVPGLHGVVRKAGLLTRLCDVDLETLSYNALDLERAMGPDTLAVVAVHLFGLPLDVEPIERLARERGADVIEDSAQALGSQFRGKWVGRHGVAALFSFERGKNISAYGGGCLVCRDDILIGRLRALESELPPRSFSAGVSAPALWAGLGFASHPTVYGLGHPLWRIFKSTRRHEDFSYYSMDPLRALFLDRTWGRLEGAGYRRMMNGRFLHAWLSKLQGIRLPRLEAEGYAAFTRLPVIIEPLEKVDAVRKDLWRAGIDAPVMFPKAVHQVYPESIPSGQGTYPKAEWLAPRLITLPVHPFVKPWDLERMVRVFERHFQG